MRKPDGEITSVRALPYAITGANWYQGFRHLTLPVILSSGSASHPAGRYDIICADPAYILRTRDQLTEILSTATGTTECSTAAPFTVLADYCPIATSADSTAPELPPFTGGAIGYFAYELLHRNSRIPRKQFPETDLPEMLVGIYDWALVIDHRQQQTLLIERQLTARAKQALDAAVVKVLAGETVKPGHEFVLTSAFSSNFSRQDYLQRFDRIIEYIRAGDCYQVNLAQCFSANCEGDPWQAFTRLQHQADAPFAAYLEQHDMAVLSFSPERFLQVSNQVVITQPIKGTRPRSSDDAIDRTNLQELTNSQKDRAENLMIVDLLRNDLGRVCSTGSVKAERLFETQSFTNVHHLVSTICGRLDQPADLFRLLPACFPGGSITGTPKQRAMEIIDELETMPRSVYCGSIAWIDYRGNMDSNICIRTLVKSGNRVHCWGGGGIVADSTGAAEYQETLDKISMFMKGL